MNVKKWMAASLMGVALLGITACGKKNDSSEGTSTGKQTLRISWWGSDTRNQAIQAAIDLFEEENPDITVKAEFSGYSGYQEKMTTQLSGGTAPDVIRLDSMWMDQYKNQLVDLKEYEEAIGMSNFADDKLASLTIDDKVLGLPLSTNYRALYYNKTVYDQYGIAAPESWEDLYAAREKLPENTYPLWSGFSPKWVLPEFFFTLLTQQTGKSIGDEDNKLQMTEADFKNALTFYSKLVEDKIMPSKKVIDNAGMVDGAPTPGIVDGEWLGMFDYTGSLASTEKTLTDAGYELALASFPSMEGQKSTGVWTKPSMVYSIPTSSKNQEAAAKLINFLMNDPEAVKAQKLENGVSDSKVGLETLEQENLITPIVQETIKLGEEKVDSNLATVFKWQTAKITEMSLDVITALDYGEMTVDEAAKKFYDTFKEQESAFE